MVSPPHRTRALGRWRVGSAALILLLTAVHACDVLSQSSPAPGQDGGCQPPTRIGAAALNATNEEKIRELVIALMGQEPGDEPRRPRTPLLAPFITHDVLLCVDHILFRR